MLYARDGWTLILFNSHHSLYEFIVKHQCPRDLDGGEGLSRVIESE